MSFLKDILKDNCKSLEVDKDFKNNNNIFTLVKSNLKIQRINNDLNKKYVTDYTELINFINEHRINKIKNTYTYSDFIESDFEKWYNDLMDPDLTKVKKMKIYKSPLIDFINEHRK